DAGIDQSFGCLEGHQIFERVAGVAPGSPGNGADQIGLVPILELAARDPDDLRDVTHAIQVAGCSHVRGRPPRPLDTELETQTRNGLESKLDLPVESTQLEVGIVEIPRFI